MTITNNKDLEFWYKYLRMLDDLPLINVDLVKKTKREIRKYTNRPESLERIFNASIDGYTTVYPLPENISSKEDAIEFFEDNERIVYRPTYYDCTGQLFTSWYKVFQRNGRFWVYHRLARDI